MARYATLAAAALGIALAWPWVGGCSNAEENLKSPDAPTCVKGVREMAQRRSEDAIEKIAPLVKHEDLIVATETVKALGQMRRPSADKVLRQAATSDARAAVRQEAVLQLGGARDAESRAVAKQAVKTDPDADVRASAITSIQKQRALDDVPLLLEVAETEKDVVVQARAVSAIEQMLHMKFNYDPKAPLAERQQALERIRASASRIAAELKERQRAMGTKR